MTNNDTFRLPPIVLHVPPPASAARTPQDWRGIGVLVLLGAVVSLVATRMAGASWTVWLSGMGTFALVMPLLLYISAGKVLKARRKLRSRMLERTPALADDPLVTALSEAWKRWDRPPKVDDVRAALQAVRAAQDSGTPDPNPPCEGRARPRTCVRGSDWQERSSHPRSVAAEASAAGDDDRALILCYGEHDVPEVGEDFFEPMIVTPTESLWRSLFWLATAGLLLLWLALDFVNVLPGWLPPARAFLGGMGYFLAAGATVLIMWVWRAMLRPRYYRFAPGVIQVLDYRFGQARPTIRSYAFDADTLAIFVGIRKRTMLTLARGDHRDRVIFAAMREPKDRLAIAWRAMLSTAASGPLSEEELVG